MPKIAYQEKRLRPETLAVVEQANTIIADYAAQGFDLTLRQLYYQFVARGLIRNHDREYDRLGSIINDARLAGLVDWNSISDRTRYLRALPTWGSPASIIQAAASGYHIDWWAGQTYRPEVWIEKDALVGVIAGVCEELDVPYFSCRGYTSQSEMWSASQRLLRHRRGGQIPIVFHLGDHDPSGVDMSRDIEDRLAMFIRHHGYPAPRFERLALHMAQVRQYNPPPNPAKLSDSRVGPYIARYGAESWELDALEPSVIAALIRDAIEAIREPQPHEDVIGREEREKALLARVTERWDDVAAWLASG